MFMLLIRRSDSAIGLLTSRGQPGMTAVGSATVLLSGGSRIPVWQWLEASTHESGKEALSAETGLLAEHVLQQGWLGLGEPPF